MKDYELENYIADLKIELDEVNMDTPRNEYILREFTKLYGTDS